MHLVRFQALQVAVGLPKKVRKDTDQMRVTDKFTASDESGQVPAKALLVSLLCERSRNQFYVVFGYQGIKFG